MASPSNLPTIQRLKYEDYSKEQNWQDAVRALVESLNLFMPQVYNILNGGIGTQNAIAPKIFTKVITAAATTTYTFVNPLVIQPSAVLIGNVWTGLRSTHPVAALQVYWHYSGNTIFIDNIVGLVAGTIYSVTLVVI